MIRNKHSIKNRLFFIIVLTSTIVLLITGLLFIVFQMVLLKQDMKNSLSIQASVLGDNAQASIVFGDRIEAGNLLTSLKYDTQVIYALLLDDENQVLAHYQRPDSNFTLAAWNVNDFLTESPVVTETKRYLVYVRPIHSQGNKIGHVVLFADFSRYGHLLLHSALVVTFVIGLALLVALVISFILQRLISKPIESLADFVSTVTQGQNYELRTEDKSYTELEQLGNAFNMLLEQIHHVITARDHAQRQLRKYSLQLKDLVYERTRQLEEAKEAAEASSKAKSAFLANMSHEIRTPMNSIVVFTKLALASSESSHQRQQLKHVLESAELLLALIDDLLDFSRIDANKLDLDYQNCNLFEILTSINQMLAAKFVEKNLEFIIDVSETVPRQIQVDSLRLKQVLINLLTNAIKFTESGQVRLTLTAHASIEPFTHRVTFSISDTGIGMDAPTIARIFEIFSQGDVSTTRKYGGTGLGLSISKKLVTLMGGELSVDSQPGQGSQFSFSLSLKTSSTSQALAVLDTPPCQPAVLVAEPLEQSREHLLKLLESLGCNVDSSETGADMLARLQRKTYSHLLISRKLPDIEAFTLVRHIKAIPAQAEVSISLMDNLLGEQSIKRFSETVTPIGYLMTPVFDRLSLYHHLLSEGPQNEPQLPPPVKAPAKTGKISSILIVDDYNINRLLVMDILGDQAERFLEAGNGQEALKILQNETVDLILMDIQMPEMDGFETTRQIRKQLQLIDLPIIGMTAFAAEHDCRKCYQAGMNDVLTKPIDVDRLRETIDLFSHVQPKPLDRTLFSEPALLSYRLPGIDVRGGLTRLRNDGENYQKLLRLFYKNYQGKDAVLEDYLEQKDWDACEAWLHDLKGICANLSITALVDSCVTLHDQLKKRTIDPADLQQFKHRFSEVIEGLEQLADSAPEPIPATETLNFQRLEQLLNRLDNAINEQSFSCHHILTDIRSLCDGRYNQTLDRLESHLQNFQYKQAARILKLWHDEINEHVQSRSLQNSYHRR
ncbi:MAG: response regulator [Gammaproteobacteria bacterium]